MSNRITKRLPTEDLDHILGHTQSLWDELSGKRIFITGGTGFFGIWLLETIAYANDQQGTKVSATILSRDPQAFLARMPHIARRTEFDWLTGHPSTFSFPITPYDYLLHLATATSAHLGQTDQSAMLKTKLASISHVLDYAKQANIRRMLVTSSGAVYGPQPPNLSHIPESYIGAPDPMDPASAYGTGKRLVEQMCSLAPEINIVIARCFSFIGPHLPLDARFAAGNFIRDVLRDQPISISGDGRAIRSYLYAADLVVWLLTLLMRGQSLCAYNVGSDSGISICDLARTVACTGKTNDQTSILSKNDDGSAPRYVPNIDRAKGELNLKTLIPLEDAIARTLDWCRL